VTRRAELGLVERLNSTPRQTGKPIAEVDLALHLGDVLYGNVGAINCLDFTVIGPAVNEVARMERYASLWAARCWSLPSSPLRWATSPTFIP
jgi:class 3 adenylate cyclase